MIKLIWERIYYKKQSPTISRKYRSKNHDIITFINEINSTAHRNIYPTNKISYNNIDEIWSIDLADFSDYKTPNKKGFRYIFVIIDDFSKYFWAIPLKNKNSQTITTEFSNILPTSKWSPSKIESDRGSDFYNNIFQNFFKKIYITILVLLIKVLV